MAQLTFATLRNNDSCDSSCYRNNISFTTISTNQSHILNERVLEQHIQYYRTQSLVRNETSEDGKCLFRFFLFDEMRMYNEIFH